jgi:ATP-dependent DNA ligase
VELGWEGLVVKNLDGVYNDLVFHTKAVHYRGEDSLLNALPWVACVRYFERSVELGWEGLIVKSLDGPYKIGDKSRNSKLWLKVKPDYMASHDNLDLLILGGYYREGPIWTRIPSRCVRSR